MNTKMTTTNTKMKMTSTKMKMTSTKAVKTMTDQTSTDLPSPLPAPAPSAANADQLQRLANIRQRRAEVAGDRSAKHDGQGSSGLGCSG